MTVLKQFFCNIGYITLFTHHFFKELFTPPYEFKEFIKQCYTIGYKYLPLVAITGFIMGLVLTQQTRPTLAKFGAESWLPRMVAISLIKETAPVVIALLCVGTATNKLVEENSLIASKRPIEIDDIMISPKKSLNNIEIISHKLSTFIKSMNKGNNALTKLISEKEFYLCLKNTLTNLQTSSNQFAKFTTNLNEGHVTLSKLMNDEQLGKTLDSTIINLKASSLGLSENIEAAKHNFLFKKYYKRKNRNEAKN
jgi:hypothetical protein